MKKLKKTAKIEKVFGKPLTEGEVFDEKDSAEQVDEEFDALSEFESQDEEEIQEEVDGALTDKQIKKQSEIDFVKSKISKILKSSNIEIVDENFGDEYELDENDNKKQSQQDYDALKALFGEKDRNKKEELTLTIDDFDYTYVGRYIEEFDLMHVKNIKHIRLKNPNAKKIKKALIAASLVCVVGLGTFFGFFMTKQKPVVMTSVSLSQTASTSNYYVGENFNFDGLFVNVQYSNGTTKKVKLTNEYFDHTEGGIVEHVGGNIQFLGGSVLMVFNYEGCLLNYNIEVKNRELSGISARYSDSIFNLEQGSYITGHLNGLNDLIILLDYGEYGITKISNYNNISLWVDGQICIYEYSRGWKVPKATKGSTITIKYENASLDQSFVYVLN